MSKDFWKGVVVGFILSLLAAYSFFRIYWIMEVGLKYLRWHATLWLYLSVAAIFFGAGYILYKYFKSAWAQKVYLLFAGLLFGIYVAELFLRLTNNGTTYGETREGVFVNPAEGVQKTWYMVGRPHQTYTLATPEFSYSRTTNSIGLADKEWSTQKDTNEIRIITLGDSFTEGDGTSYDSSYPRLLERLLQKDFPQAKVNVLNAGKCGSDPWFEYKKLKDLLLIYKPDIVVYTTGSNDLFYDHLIYGGLERFLSDSTVKNKIPNHKWLGLYGVSYLFRLVINFAGYDETLFGITDRELNKKTAIADSHELSRAFSRLAVQNNFKCIQLIRCERPEIVEGKYDYLDLGDLLSQMDTLPLYSTFNILQFYKDSLHIDQSNTHEYFWSIDGHHNAKGYEAMAKAVYSCTKPLVTEKVHAAF